MLGVLMAVAMLAAGEAHIRQQPKPANPDAAVPQENLSDDEIRQRIDAYLGTIDTPVPLARWRALGPRAAPFLEEIAASPTALPTQRAKAIDGLSAVGGQNAPAVLTRLSRAEKEPLVVRLSAVRGMGRLEHGAKLAAALRPVMEGAKDARVRGQAAEALSERAPKAACSAVKAQADKEDEQARVHYRAALERCGAAPEQAPAGTAR